MRITPKGAQLILDNLVAAVSAIIGLVPDGIDFVEFLTTFMVEADLPAFLSHEDQGLREAATIQLRKLAEAEISRGDQNGT